MRLAEIKPTFGGDKGVLQQHQQQVSLLLLLHWDPFTPLHATLSISGGKLLARLTLVLKEIWAGPNETESHCQLWKATRICCSYWHIPVWGEREQEPLGAIKNFIYSSSHSSLARGELSFQALLAEFLKHSNSHPALGLWKLPWTTKE